MSLFEVDIDALQNLITVLDTVENELDNQFHLVDSAFSTFLSSFVSPDASNLEANRGELLGNSCLLGALNKTAEIEDGAKNLLAAIQNSESVHF